MRQLRIHNWPKFVKNKLLTPRIQFCPSFDPKWFSGHFYHIDVKRCTKRQLWWELILGFCCQNLREKNWFNLWRHFYDGYNVRKCDKNLLCWDRNIGSWFLLHFLSPFWLFVQVLEISLFVNFNLNLERTKNYTIF